MAHRPDYESADYKEGYEDGKREASKEWQSLSYEEILRLEGLDCVDEEYIKRFVRAIEAKLREKNNG